MPLPPRDPRTGLFLKRGTRRNPDWTRTSTRADRAARRATWHVKLVDNAKKPARTVMFGPYATERGANVEAKSLLYAVKRGVRTSHIETTYGDENPVTGNRHEEAYRLIDKASGNTVAKATLVRSTPALSSKKLTPPRKKAKAKAKSAANPRSNPKRDRKGRFVKRR